MEDPHALKKAKNGRAEIVEVDIDSTETILFPLIKNIWI
jgi:hypothetical protein